MREGLSHRIVAFIANLQPIYTHALIDDRICARSLIDGTLILPLEEPEEDEDRREDEEHLLEGGEGGDGGTGPRRAVEEEEQGDEGGGDEEEQVCFDTFHDDS